MVDYVRRWADRAELPVKRILSWLGVPEGTYYKWIQRYGRANEHNGWIPRDHWLEDWERQAILDFHDAHPGNGYRRLAYMMLDRDVVAVSATSVYRVLKGAGALRRFQHSSSKKGDGFEQPLRPHEHWHIDVAYLNIAGTFYFLATILDGYSRYIVHWEIRERMQEVDVEIIVQRAREKYPRATPRIISDNGPQFVAKDFKAYVRLCGMTHVRTSPYYPQSNGKLERYHRSLKSECIRPKTPLCLEDAQRTTATYVHTYNEQRLHSALGYITPRDMLEGRAQAIQQERDRKLEAARERRAEARQRARSSASYTENTWTEDRALLGSTPSAVSGPEAKPGGHAPPAFSSSTLLLAECDKPQGDWGTESPIN